MEESLSTVWRKYPSFFSSIPSLKDEQREVVESIIGGKDTFVSLPTGFGKSLTYVVPPLVADELEDGIQHIALVVSPLLTIIYDQVKKLRAANIKAHALTGDCDPADIEAVKAGKTQIVFMTPECAAARAFRETFRSLARRITVLVLDECHCLFTWGKSFRKSYRKLGEMTSFVSCPLLFLTATATVEVYRDIQAMFDVRDCVVVSKSPDRENIRLHMEYTTHNIQQLQWLLDYYIEHGAEGKKTLLFTTGIADTTEIYLWMLDELDSAGKAYTGDSKLVDERIIDMYHAHMSEDTDYRVQTQYPKATSTVRLLITTIKMGMGVDISDIDLVILFGAPQHVIDLWQELGRAARGPGRKGLGAVYLTGLSLKNNVDPTIQKLINEEECFRKTILDAFTIDGSVPEVTAPPTPCSGSCKNICECSRCSCCNFCSNSCTCSAARADLRDIFHST